MEFTNALKGFGVEYFGFAKTDFADFSYDKEKTVKIFEDVFRGGPFGRKEERESFFEAYNACRFATFKNEDFETFMTRWRRTNMLKALSFSRKNMVIRYPYAKKIYLLPVAWVAHVFVIIKTGLETV